MDRPIGPVSQVEVLLAVVAMCLDAVALMASATISTPFALLALCAAATTFIVVLLLAHRRIGRAHRSDKSN